MLRDNVEYPLPKDVPVTVLHKNQPWDIPRTIFRLRKYLQTLRPDVVLGTMISTSWLIGAALGQNRHPRWVGRFAVSLDWHENLRDRAFSKIVGHFLRRMDAWVGNSQGLASEIHDFFRTPRDRIFTIGNPIDFEELDTLAARTNQMSTANAVRPVIISVGRLCRQKRHDLLIDAFAQVRKRTETQLIICGEGPLRESLQSRAERLGVARDVLLVGHDSNPFRRLGQADLFVLTSDREGLPNALIEAQALGLPAVSTRCPTGPEEIIEDGVTGFLVPVGDADAIASAILDLLSDVPARRRLGAAARERIHSLYDHEMIVAKWEDVLDPHREGRIQ
jgi:glycosyltransferase involved in cell wall biosynthesis